MGIRNREKESSLSHEWLKGLLSYDCETGKLTWLRAPRRGVGVASEVGCIRPDGYRTVTIKGEAFLAANLIWFLVHGEWPEHSVDHINRDRSDDRLCNLRAASQTENNFNQKTRSDNSLGIRGVSFDQSRGKFVAYITKEGRLVSRKRYPTLDGAVAARRKLEAVHCGEFASHEEARTS